MASRRDWGMASSFRYLSSMCCYSAGGGMVNPWIIVFGIGHAEPVLLLRELAANDLVMIRLQAVQDHLAGVSEDLGHARLESGVQPEHVMVDQQLAMCMRTRPK